MFAILLVILRTLFIYCATIAAMRLMGKKQLGELQPSELVSTILISNLASISIETPDLPLTGSLVPVFIIVAIEILLSALCVKSRKAATLVAGSPRIIIAGGVLDQKTLFDLRFTMDDLLEALRAKDVFELGEVDFAIVETNGTVSVRKKTESETPTKQELSIPPAKAAHPSLPIVTDGQINGENLRQYQLNEAFVDAVCRREGCVRGEVLLLLCNDAKETNLIKKEDRRMHKCKE